MGLFDYKKQIEQRDAQIEELTEENKQLRIGGVPITSNSTINGITVSRDKIMQIPVAKACTDLIANDIASLPIYLYKDVNGTMEKINSKDKRLRLLNDENEENMDAGTFKRMLVEDMLYEGQAFANLNYEKKRVAGRELFELNELNYLPSKDMARISISHNGVKYTRATYQLTTMLGNHTGNSNAKEFKHDLLRIVHNPKHAFEGVGVLERGKTVFAQALAEMEYKNSLYSNGALPIGVLTTDKKLDGGVIGRLRESWKNLYSGIRNSAKKVILEDGLKYQKMSMNPNELQLNETANKTNSDICKLFNVPESMVTSSANKYNSVAQNNVHFKRHTLKPIIDTIENALNRQLLTESEKKQGYCFRFDTRELLRTTDEELSQSLVTLVENGVITTNEAQYELDKSKVEGGDDLRLSLGVVSQNTDTGETTVHNMDGGTKQNNKKEVVSNE